jgi:hypothetical protein
VSQRPQNVPVAAAKEAMEATALPAASLIFHSTDFVVRPLVGNRCAPQHYSSMLSSRAVPDCVPQRRDLISGNPQ